jgi:hypothetical protein
MNKLLATLIAGFFAISVNTAFAADTTAPTATGEKPAAHAVKKGHSTAHKKTHAKTEVMHKADVK